ncbi:hypothetical protein MN032_10945 [Agromyces atrinae]|uniref:hypothetical protein n=1 Tax=Agromyces atrinae TaxID=592376 RepID=UPI001F5753D4|nr:hypothetical protein [Agromyces atrinae]MCI2958214.1 hypothetical protein [Agromyces atrinae]
MIMHLRSIETSGQSLGERVSASLENRLIVPESWLVADELLEALTGHDIPSTATIDDTAVLVDDAIAAWQNVELRASREDDAAAAVVLTIVMQRALRRWPGAEVRVRDIPGPIYCLKCSTRAMKRIAPIEFLGDLEAKCGACGEVEDWWAFQKRASRLVGEVESARKQEERKAREKRRKQREKAAS